MTGTFFRTDH